MSGILKNKKYFKIGFCVFVDIVLLIFFIRWWYLIVVLNIVASVFILLNRYVKILLIKQKSPFGYKSKIRNVDYLIIGDLFRADSVLQDTNKSFVQLKAPERSLLASFEILKHTSSILKEAKGTVVLVCKQKNIGIQKFNVFDEIFFIGITLKKYHIEFLKRYKRIPLLSNPFLSIKFLCDCCEDGYKVSECPSQEISDFCKERELKLVFMTK